MISLGRLLLILPLIANWLCVASSWSPRPISSVTPSSETKLSSRQRGKPETGGSIRSLNALSGGETPELQDFSGKGASLFGDLRIPTALFAGASAGAAFAMPLAHDDGIKRGLVKRMYTLLMMGSFSCEMITLVVATITISAISLRKAESTYNVMDFIERHYLFEWVSARLGFLGGILLFLIATGLRAWVNIGCPVYALASLGVISSAATFCLGIVNAHERENGRTLFALPSKFFELFVEKLRSDVLLSISFVLATVTGIFVLAKFPHVIRYLGQT